MAELSRLQAKLPTNHFQTTPQGASPRMGLALSGRASGWRGLAYGSAGVPISGGGRPPLASAAAPMAALLVLALLQLQAPPLWQPHGQLLGQVQPLLLAAAPAAPAVLLLLALPQAQAPPLRQSQRQPLPQPPALVGALLPSVGRPTICRPLRARLRTTESAPIYEHSGRQRGMKGGIERLPNATNKLEMARGAGASVANPGAWLFKTLAQEASGAAAAAARRRRNAPRPAYTWRPCLPARRCGRRRCPARLVPPPPPGLMPGGRWRAPGRRASWPEG